MCVFRANPWEFSKNAVTLHRKQKDNPWQGLLRIS